MFELLNVKWGEPTFGTPSGTVTWSSDLGGDLVLGDGATDTSINATLNRALEAWENVAAVDFVRDDVNPMFTFDATALDPDFAGVAIFRPNLGGLNTLDSGEIFFNSQYVWSDNGGTNSTDFYAVALHEIGHMIGLDHPNDPSQIMNAIIRTDDLGDGDIRGAQFIYGTDGDDVPLAPAPTSSDSSSGGGGGGGGLILGLLALIASLFAGGGGALVAMAAGQISGSRVDDTEEDGLSPDDVAMADPLLEMQPLEAGHYYGDGHNHGGGHFHGVAIEDFVLLPSIDFTQQPNPCGCVGMCGHILNDGDCFEEAFV